MPTQDEYVKALEKLKGRDRIGIAGEMAATGAGVAAGYAASGTVAGAFGATQIFGYSTLGSLLGGVFVTTTPVGWVIGSAIAAGAVGYGISKVCQSGGKQDEVRRGISRDLRKKIEERQRQRATTHNYEDFLNVLIEAVSKGALNPEQSDRLIRLVNGQALEIDTAINRVNTLIKSHQSSQKPL